jgi:hypothetical protein
MGHSLQFLGARLCLCWLEWSQLPVDDPNRNMFMSLFREMPVLVLLQGAFTIWMLVDCYRRGAEIFWFWIILFFPGVGPWIYFFAVKVHDFREWNGLNFWPFQHRPSLEAVRHQVAQGPTLANRLLLSELLTARGEHAEASQYLEAILRQEPDHCQTLHLLAACQIELHHPELAVPLLQKVIARDRQWSNYRAWHTLRKACVASGDMEAALRACQELVKNSPTLQHQCVLAEQLFENNQADQALQVLDSALEDHQYAPGPIRRRNRRWAGQARKLRKQIAQQAGSTGET